MKKVSSAFFKGLKRGNSYVAMCWRIERDDGVTLCFTEHDQSVSLAIDGITYETYLPTNSFSSSAFEGKSDMSVDNISVVALSSDLITEEDLHAGKYDDADVKIFVCQWDHPEWGTMPLMGCSFGEITFNDGTFEAELRSRIQALQQTIGRVHSLECDAVLGDARCKKDLTAFTTTGVVSGIYDELSFIDTTRTEPDDWFQYGDIIWLTGRNAGLHVEIRGYKLGPQIITLLETPAYVIERGDTFTIIAGCDKTKPTCIGKYNNIDNMRGFPDMPTEQTITSTPDAK